MHTPKLSSQVQRFGWVVPIAGLIAVILSPYAGVTLYWQNQLILIAIYSLLVSGINLSFGYAGEMNLGQVAVFAGGAYTTAILYEHGIAELAIAIPASIVVAALVGLLTGIPGLRLTSFALAMTSFFLVLLIPPLVDVFEEETGGTVGLPGIIGPEFLGRPLETYDFFVVSLVITGLWFAVFRNLVASRVGQSLQVLRASPLLAQSLGLSVFKLKVTAYVVAGLPAGVAGSIFAYLSAYVAPVSFPLTMAIALLAASVVGGKRSVYGAVLGSTLLVLGPLSATAFAKYNLVFYGAFLCIIGTVFSGGIVGLLLVLRRRVAARSGADAAVGADGGVAEHLDIPGERLVVSGVTKSFGGLRALDGVDLTAEAGTITAIMGANGAGKTTLLNAISGLIPPDEGSIQLGSRELTGSAPHRLARHGVGRTFQAPLVPEAMTVKQVVATGRLRHGAVSMIETVLRLPRFHRAQRDDNDRATAALSFAGLSSLAEQQADALPLGTRRLLEVVRSVAGEPNVLLLDEPAAGLDDTGLTELGLLMTRARDAGATVVLVEHNVPFLLAIADTIHVMDLGKVVASGTPDVIRTNPTVTAIYLGRRHGTDAPVEPVVIPDDHHILTEVRTGD